MRGMFTRIAGMYDVLNRVLTLGLDVWWRRRALGDLAEMAAPRRVLDLATGTGDVALGLARKFPEARIVGLDLTAAMLAIARRKVERAGLAARIELREGDAGALPFGEGEFDAVTCAFGFRNFPDRRQALEECRRVLAEGGRVVVLELFRNGSSFLARFTSLWLRALSCVFARRAKGDYAYLRASIERTATVEEFLEDAEAAGFAVEKRRFFRPSCHCIILKKLIQY